MMTGFRIISYETGLPDTDLLNPTEENVHRRKIDMAPLPSVETSGSRTWISIILGRNGLGKSRALGEIATIFSNLHTGRNPRHSLDRGKSRKKRTWRLRYAIGEDDCELICVDGLSIQASVNKKSLPVNQVPFPSKIVALSTTAMDKFPLPPVSRQSGESSDSDLYSYMGLRDRTGRSSPTAAVHRALEALMEAESSTVERRTRVAEVFNYLGYVPWVEQTYRWRYSALADGTKSIGELMDEHRNRGDSRVYSTKLLRTVGRDQESIDKIQRIVDEYAELTDDKVLRVSSNFSDVKSIGDSRFDEIHLLRRAGIIELQSVELERIDTNIRVELREISSGELSLVTAFLGLAAVIENNSLVLIDEPEVSLHPEWQVDYLKLLTRIFDKYQGCHFIIATHSPLIVSDMPPFSANVISLDRSGSSPVNDQRYSGDSIDEILVRAFNVTGKNNLFVKQLLVESLRIAASGDVDSPRFVELVDILKPILPGIADDTPLSDLITEIVNLGEVHHS